jgi:glycosyltransferase involved in cell wall biosynthesis
LLEQSWSRSTALADALIIFGNSHTAGTYAHYPGQQVFSFDATALVPRPANTAGKNMESCRNAFLWFGSTTGGVQKGLDLCLECFAAKPEVTLHLCGCIEDEIAHAYSEELSRPNIVAHGFVDVRSPVFEETVGSCAFAILPTCAEGQSTALLTVMGQGLIPVTTVAAGIDIEGLGILIDELTATAVSRAVEKARHIASHELEEMARKSAERILSRHTLDKFEQNLENILRQLIQQRC